VRAPAANLVAVVEEHHARVQAASWTAAVNPLSHHDDQHGI